MVSSVVRKFILRLIKRRSEYSCKWHLLRIQVQCFMSGGTFKCGRTHKLNVPVRCDGRGRVALGDHVSLGYSKAPRIGNGEVLVQARSANSTISIGNRTATSNNVSIIANQSIAIGSDCIIGDNVMIIDSDFHEIDPVQRLNSTGKGQCSPVSISNNVWLGSRVMVLKGVQIGDNSIIAPGAIVTKSVPENALAGGVPAKVIRSLTD